MIDQPSPLMEVILSFLTPLLLAGGITEIDLARRAAREAIAAHQTGGSLVSIAQAVAFAMASLDSLRLSVPQDLSVTMKLRLRGNANALNRSSHRAASPPPRPRPNDAPAQTEASRQSQASVPTAAPGQSEASVPTAASPRAEAPAQTAASAPAASASNGPPKPQPAETDRRREHAWANAMTDVAAECSRNLATLSPNQRRAETIRIAALNAAARQLSRSGATPLDRLRPREP
jgi:DNA polymerase III gamma/tau subunit